MSSSVKSGIFALALLVFCGAAAPPASAQGRGIAELFQLESTGAYLGIQMEDVTGANMGEYKLKNEKGVIVRSVTEGSPASKAGLREDDVILEYSGFQVWSSIQLGRLVRETPPGRKVDLAVVRDGKTINLTAEIGIRGGGGNTRSERRMEIEPEDFFGGLRQYPFEFRNRERAEPGEPSKPRLGITLQPLTEQLAEFMGVPEKRGVLVASVNEGSPSAGKLKSGDVIIQAAGKRITGPEDLTELVSASTGGPIALKVIREKKEISVTVDLPELPEGDGKGIRL